MQELFNYSINVDTPSRSASYRFALIITLNSQSQVNNSSNITFKFQCTTSNGWGYVGWSGPTAQGWLNANGSTSQRFSKNVNTIAVNSTTVINEETIDIAHNSSGDLDILYDAIYTGATTGSVVPKSVTISVASVLGEAIHIPSIPRGTQIQSLSSQTLGVQTTLTMQSFISGSTYTTTYAVGSYSGSVTNNTVTIPLSVLTTNPTGKSVSVVFTTKTYSGSTLVDTKAQTYTFTARDSDITPEVITNVSCTPVGAEQFLQNITACNVKFTISSLNGKYGATIKTYEVKAQGELLAQGSASAQAYDLTSQVFTTSGSKVISVSVTDSRSIKQTINTTITVSPYQMPTQVGISNGVYRLFFKDIFDLDGEPILGSQTKVLKMKIKDDLEAKATSTFEIVEIPNAIEIGDVVGCYDEQNGKVIYTGKITDVDYSSNTITAQQLLTIFDNDFFFGNYYGDAKTYYEQIWETWRLTCLNLFGNNNNLNNTYGDMLRQWGVSVKTSTSNTHYPTATGDSRFAITNIFTKAIEMYNSYNILVVPEVTMVAGTSPVLNILNPSTYSVYNTWERVLSDNTNILRNFNIIKQNPSYTHIVIQNKDQIGMEHMQKSGANCFMITNDNQLVSASHITTIPHNFKQKIIGVDAEQYNLSDPNVLLALAYDNMQVEQYNHQIELDMVLNNKLFDFFTSFRLGQEFTIYHKDKVYHSVFTGYSIDVNNDGRASEVHMVFGKARLSLESVLLKNGISN